MKHIDRYFTTDRQYIQHYTTATQVSRENEQSYA